MWARRCCAAPPNWPSRVKVSFLSIGTAAIGVAVYQVLAGDNVDYLDLNEPSLDRVLCLTQWPLRSKDISYWTQFDIWRDWATYRFDPEAYLREHACPAPPLGIANATCLDVQIPINCLRRNLGQPMGVGKNFSYDLLNFYAWLFLLLSCFLFAQVVCHDLALLTKSNKSYVYDLKKVNEEFPRIHQSFNLMRQGYLCLPPRIRLLGNWKRKDVIPVVILAPLFIVWGLVVFLLVYIPMVLLVFLMYPVKMSRVGSFIGSIACCVYGLVLTVHQLVYLSLPHSRAQYAVTWEVGPHHAGGMSAASECVCGCVYPLSLRVVLQFLLVGVITIIKSIFLAMRCLKGLRRSNWANLLSVTFTVPLTAYAVEWTRPRGEPIKFRTKGEPVQGELAFDPFAMMDEQPDSRYTTLTLKPTLLYKEDTSEKGTRSRWKVRSSRTHEGPCVPSHEDMDVEEVEHVGCCGFPYRGGLQGRIAIPPSPAGEHREDGAIKISEISMEESVISDSWVIDGSASSPDTESACKGRRSRLTTKEIVGEVPTEYSLVFDSDVERLGFKVLWLVGEHPVVACLIPSSEAERQGMASGDRLLEINSISTEGKSRDELYPLLRIRPLRLRLERPPWRDDMHLSRGDSSPEKQLECGNAPIPI